MAAVIAGGLPAGAVDDFERPPIAYSETAADNAISRLQARIDAGKTSLPRDDRLGYLPALLDALDVPVSSQMLVFSKTSLQQQRITPQNPRALYFNDDVYVGYVRGGTVLELSVADPRLGTVFYTLDQDPAERATFVRQTEDCLICHGGSQTAGVPGHVVRSVYVDASGQPIFSAGSHRVDHTTPLINRFGGWYVTGTHGPQQHLGNVTFRKRPDHDGVDDMSGLNRIDVSDRFGTAGYPSGHSDLVALMVFAHQAAAHNAITKAGFESRAALHREAALNRELGEAADHRWPSTTTVLDAAAESLVECFLLCDEPPLAAAIGGTTDFAREFSSRGPTAPDGRSLRALDLNTRLFRHPCSYLVYDASFARLPAEVRDRFWRRLDAVLSGPDAAQRFAHLSAADRTAIREILAATHAGAPVAWKGP
ncbi:MAG: hypothetical protein K8S94_16620 [Planctomycetia bacterium]|nr:hypothetical protein [Planctomycetia bacterium]